MSHVKETVTTMQAETVIVGEHDEKTVEQIAAVAGRAVRTALMADGHLGYIMPIGGVAGYVDMVSVPGVGFDIACGNCAVQTDWQIDTLTGLALDDVVDPTNPHKMRTNPVLRDLADEIFARFAFGVGGSYRPDDNPSDHEFFEDPAWYALPDTGPYAGLRSGLMDKARRQFGSIGSGNHYVDVFVDGDGYIWVGVHFGSRGLGHSIASGYLSLANGGRWTDRGPEVETLLDVTKGLGWEYWHLMELAGRYAYACRDWVCDEVVRMMGGSIIDRVHNNHNFAWRETHAVRADHWEGDVPVETHRDPYRLAELVVVRKGATPAWPGQRGFVGGSMGDVSVILRGAQPQRGQELGAIDRRQKDLMYSTVHGAGRVLGRAEAKKGKHLGDGERDTSTIVTRDAMEDWIRARGLILRGADVDESPQAYRRLPDVLAAQGATIEVEKTLHPLIACMAPSGKGRR